MSAFFVNRLAAAGLPPTAGDQYARYYPAIVAQAVNCPGGWAQWTKDWCEANLRARAFIYYRKHPDDCGGAPGQAGINPAVAAGGLTGAGSSIVGTALGAGTEAASKAANAIPIIGSIIALGLGIFSAIRGHHAAAVEREQAVGCAMAAFVTQSVQGIDAQLLAGNITATQAIAATVAMEQQTDAPFKSISQDCNFGHYSMGFVHAFTLFAQQVYPTVVENKKAASPLSSTTGKTALVIAGTVAAGAFLL